MKSLCIKINIVLILFLVLSFSGTAFALRCGTKLIDIGDSKERILEYCGPPSQVVVTGRGYSTHDNYVAGMGNFSYGASPSGFKPFVAEEWIYNFGSTNFLKHLQFKNNTLKRIKTGERGFAE